MSNPKKRFKKMKKFILSLGLIAMAFNLTNCVKNEEITPSVETKGDFEIYASVSRTANDGLNTVWSTGDDLAVFHAVTDATTYTKDGQFKLEDVATGRFLGNVNGTLDPQEEYDWYAMYPYSSYVPGPANTGSGYMTIGCAAGANQTQVGNNSMAHVAGKNYPIVGKAYAVPAGLSPALTMTHVASLVEFEITNSLEEAFTVSSIQFTTPEQIVGTFYIDFTDIANIKAASSGANYTSSSATLAVTDGVAIAKGASAKFYLPVAPFTAKAGANLTVVVTATSESGSGAHEKTIALTSDVAFKSGKIKNVKVNYTTPFATSGGGNEGDVLTEVTHDFTKISNLSSWGNSYVAHTVEYDQSTVTFASASKQTSTITNMPVTKGGAVSLVAKNGSTIKSAKFVCAQWSSKAQTITLKYSTDGGESYASTGVTSTNFTISKDNLPEGTDAVQITFSNTSNQVGIQSATITYVTNEAAASAPRLSVDPSTVEFTAEGGSQAVTCTVENEVSGVNVTATASADWVTTSVSDKTVTITATENTGDARTATVTIAYEGAESETVTVNQLGAAAKVWTLVTDASTLAAGDQIIIAAKDYNYAISTTQNNNNRGQAAITKSGNTLSTPSSSVQIITLEAGKSAGTWAFNVGSAGYLYAASSSSNYLRSEKTLSANSSWNVTIASGTATIKATGSYTRNVMQYNQSSSLFACYSSASQKALAIYKLQ